MPVIESVPSVNIRNDFDRMMGSVLPAMGYSAQDLAKVPSLQSFQDGMSPHQARYLTDGYQEGSEDTFVIVPKVGGRNGMGVVELINRTDPDAYQDSFVWKELWGADGQPGVYADKASEHNNGLNKQWEGLIIKGDSRDPRSGNGVYDAGLVHTGLVVAHQKDVLRYEIETAKRAKIHLVGAPIGAICVDSVDRKLNPDKVQRKGWARLVQYKPKMVDGSLRVPTVGGDGGRLGFGGSAVGGGWGDRGLVRAVRVLPKT